MRNELKPIIAPDAPKALGPYSAAIRAGGFVYLSGQTPIDPTTGNLAPGGIAEQTERCILNLGAVLHAAGLSFDRVVKTTCFLTDMADFAAFNEVYARFFTGKPARSTVAVKALPRGAMVEIELVALADAE